MKTCASHSCGIHAWWLVVYENRSVTGIVWLVQMTSPVFRFHHRSGSSKRDRTVSTAITSKALDSITGKERSRRMSCVRTEMPYPKRAAMPSSGIDRLPQVLFERRIGIGETNQPVQISAGDRQTACGERLIPIALADSSYSQLDFVIAKLALK